MTDRLTELTDAHDDFTFANQMAIKAVLMFQGQFAIIRNHYRLISALKPLRNKSKTYKTIYKYFAYKELIKPNNL